VRPAPAGVVFQPNGPAVCPRIAVHMGIAVHTGIIEPGLLASARPRD